MTRAVECSKEVLTHVDHAVNTALAHHRLEEIQRRLDKSAFEKFDHPMATDFKVTLSKTRHCMAHCLTKVPQHFTSLV